MSHTGESVAHARVREYINELRDDIIWQLAALPELAQTLRERLDGVRWALHSWIRIRSAG